MFRSRRRVEITGGFWLVLFWFALANGWEITGQILLAAGLHELGHLAALKVCGASVESLRLCGVGAVMELRGTLPYGAELISVLAGPMVNLLLGGILSRTGQMIPAGIHLVLGGFNLLPVRPLDGGRALELLVSWRWGPDNGERAARACGIGVGALMASGLTSLIWYSGGNLWLLPPAAAFAGGVLREWRGETGISREKRKKPLQIHGNYGSLS